MYEFKEITKFIPLLKVDKIAESIKPDGLRGVHVTYTPVAQSFIETCHSMYDEVNHDFYFKTYPIILTEQGLTGKEEILKLDFSHFTARSLFALIIAMMQTDRLCSDMIYSAFQIGYLYHWLERLKELDESTNDDGLPLINPIRR